MGLNVLVTGGYFDDGADGVVHHVELDSGRVETWARWRPPPHLSVPRKGFAGGQRDATHLYVAAHAAVVRFNVERAVVDGVLHQPDFNDLHGVAITDDELLVVNTGCDAIDRFTRDGVFLGRHTWTPGWAHAERMHGRDFDLDAACVVGWSGGAPERKTLAAADRYYTPVSERSRTPFCQTRVRDRVHPNHVVKAHGEWLVTCLNDGCVRSLTDLRPRLRLSGYPHDGAQDDNCLWFTTIDGGVWRTPLPVSAAEAQRVAEAFVPGRVGWCRGLLLTAQHIVVGLTEVRRDRLPKHRWADADPDASVTGLVVLERDTGTQVQFIDLTDRARHHKIYSIVEVV